MNQFEFIKNPLVIRFLAGFLSGFIIYKLLDFVLRFLQNSDTKKSEEKNRLRIVRR